MAYRRRQGITRASTFKEEIYHPPPSDDTTSSSSPSSNFAPASASPSLAAQAIRASAANRGSSLSSALHSSSFKSDSLSLRDSATYEYTSLKTTSEAGGFWGVVARKAKAILDDDNMSEEFGTPSRANARMPCGSSYSTAGQFNHPYQSPESSRKVENTTLRKGLDALTSSLNQIGDSIGNALEEGRSLVENKTADIIQETRKLQIRRKEGTNPNEQIHVSGIRNPWQEPAMYSAQPQIQSNKETQLKASRDVAMATAAKAKLLLRELKTVKADLAFAKQRCSQLEEENKILREAYEKGDHPADDDMIRLQLETLLAEKARLARENSIFARENRFLREIVEYHQLTMQDVVYLDEGIEEVTEVYPIPAVSRMLSVSPPSPRSPCPAHEITPSRSSAVARESSAPIPPQAIANVIRSETSPTTVQLQVIADVPQSEAPPSSSSPVARESSAPISPQAIANVIQSETSPTTVQLQAIADVPESEAPPSSSSPVSTPKTSTRQSNPSA